MNPTESSPASRRTFIKNSGKVAAATALAGVIVPQVHAAVDDTIQIALIGCGGRGAAQRSMPCRSNAARPSWSPWPTSFRTG